jgi:hypothetical protein
MGASTIVSRARRPNGLAPGQDLQRENLVRPEPRIRPRAEAPERAALAPEREAARQLCAPTGRIERRDHDVRELGHDPFDCCDLVRQRLREAGLAAEHELEGRSRHRTQRPRLRSDHLEAR